MPSRLPQLRDQTLTFPTPNTPSISIDTLHWRTWLNQQGTRSFAYHGPAGSFTARKEQRQRGGSYWVAYRKSAGKQYHCYLGNGDSLTQAALVLAAQTLTEAVRKQQVTSVHEDQLLVTKLFVPPAAPGHVARPTPQAYLADCLAHQLTIITAPAGFGKTSLVAAWARAAPQPLAWLSLEAADNELRRFLRYFIAAYQRAIPGCGHAAQAMIEARGPIQQHEVLASLLNDVSTIGQVCWIILDDYHTIDNRDVHDALLFLIEHAPPELRFVLISRTDPPLPLARLRARGVAAEIRAAQLRFQIDEASALLAPLVPLTANDVVLLTERTEGWAVGLRLAALALQHTADRTAMIRTFTGNQQYIVDYLVDEVLEQQDAQTQAFLLATAILDQFNADLCAALLGETPIDACQARIEQIERGGMFLTALDSERRWFRYHHLFGDMLRQRIHHDRQQLRILHQRASVWYEQHAASGGTGFLDQAIIHASAIEDWQHVGRMIDDAAAVLFDRGDIPRLLRWMLLIPEPQRAELPEMCFTFGLMLSMTGQSPAAAPWIDRAERIWHAEHSPRLTSIYSLRAHIARTRFQPEQAIAYANAALDLQPHAPTNARADLLLIVGTGHGMLGESDAALDALDEAAQLAAHYDSALLKAMIACCLGSVYYQRARLHAADERCRSALIVLADGSAWPIVDAHVRLGTIAYEWNQLPQAEARTRQASETAVRIGIGGALLAGNWLTVALLCHARGDQVAAQAAIEESINTSIQAANQTSERIARAVGAQLNLACGDIDAARRWRAAVGIAATDRVPALREYEYLVLARLLLAEDASDQALALLHQINARAAEQGRTRSQIASLVLLALAHQQRSDISAAISTLANAIMLGSAEGFRRIFIDEGPTLAHLLIRLCNTRHSRDAVAPAIQNYAASLLEHMPAHSAETTPPQTTATVRDPRFERLSNREQAVLRLIAQGASNQDIAQQLVLAPATVKKHIGNILGKLAAQSRTHAVARARELGIL